jgi:hypothetical protein
MFHKNAYTNTLPHHLYQIIDKIDGDVFKYGISCDPIGADGMSDRMRKQVNLFNLIDDWERFFAIIILYDIAGKIEARQIETEYIRTYELKNGQKPRGNIRY